MRVDFEFSVFYAHGRGFRMSRGFNIGSNLAAGGACLFAAHVESMMFALQPAGLLREWADKVLALPWTDDLWVVIAGIPSADLQHLVALITRMDSYHEELELKRTEGEEAFGFLVSLRA